MTGAKAPTRASIVGPSIRLAICPEVDRLAAREGAETGPAPAAARRHLVHQGPVATWRVLAVGAAPSPSTIARPPTVKQHGLTFFGTACVLDRSQCTATFHVARQVRLPKRSHRRKVAQSVVHRPPSPWIPHKAGPSGTITTTAIQLPK